MKTRNLAACAAVLSLFGVSTALAVDGDPISGVGVSVEADPAGIMIPTADCTTKYRGTLVKRADGKWICQLPIARATTGGNPLPIPPMTTTSTTTPKTKTPAGN